MNQKFPIILNFVTVNQHDEFGTYSFEFETLFSKHSESLISQIESIIEKDFNIIESLYSFTVLFVVTPICIQSKTVYQLALEIDNIITSQLY